MNNKTYQQFSAKTSYSGRKPLSKQTGVSKLLLLIVISGIGYGSYIANQKGILTYAKVSSLTKSVSSKISAKNDDFKGYGIQLMATQQLEQAKTLMNDFARDGYSAFVLKSSNKGRTLYKVRLGPYTHRPEAEAIKDKVVQRYPQNPYVKTSLVIYKPE